MGVALTRHIALIPIGFSRSTRNLLRSPDIERSGERGSQDPQPKKGQTVLDLVYEMITDCPKCGEPWDIDSFHDEAAQRHTGDDNTYGRTFARVIDDFQHRGCVALGATCNDVADTETDDTFGLTRAEAAGALYDLLGDDIDGAASMLDDMFGL